jgi:hypothetical protein
MSVVIASRRWAAVSRRSVGPEVVRRNACRGVADDAREPDETDEADEADETDEGAPDGVAWAFDARRPMLTQASA